MGTIIVDLTFSPPASPQTPTSTAGSATGNGGSPSSVAPPAPVVEKEPTPLPRRSLLEEGEQPAQPLLKRVRAGSEPVKESPDGSNPKPRGQVRSSSENDVKEGKGRVLVKVQVTKEGNPKKAPEIPKPPVAESLPATVADDVTKPSPKPVKAAAVVKEARANPNPNPNVESPLLITREQTTNLRMLLEYAKQQKRLGLMPSEDDQVVPAVPPPPRPFLASIRVAQRALPPPPSPALTLSLGRVARNPNVVINRMSESEYYWVKERPVPETLRLFPEEIPLFPMTSERRRGDASTSRAAGDESKKETRGKRLVGDNFRF